MPGTCYDRIQTFAVAIVLPALKSLKRLMLPGKGAFTISEHYVYFSSVLELENIITRLKIKLFSRQTDHF